MTKARLAAKSRAHLDERFRALGSATRYASPVRGWIKAIREALGMSTAQLAKRLAVKQPSVVALEQSEAKGTIELATLRRVANALDCTLVYALVPNKPLEAMVRDQPRAFALRRLEPAIPLGTWVAVIRIGSSVQALGRYRARSMKALPWRDT